MKTTSNLNLAHLREPKYLKNQLLISEYTDGAGHAKYKLVYMKALRNSGLDIPADEPDILPDDNPPETVPDKAYRNLLRARSVIYELAYCNPWDWFFTGTIAPDKLDRSDLDGFRIKLAQRIRDYNKKYGLKIKYLLVPELHRDRINWHVHGFLMGLPVSHLHRFQVGDQMSAYIAGKVSRGLPVYKWQRYEDCFGFCDLEPIASHDGACKYVTKYIAKDADKSVTGAYKHTYYASQGLQRRLRIVREDIKPEMLDYINQHPNTYKGEHTACLWLDSLDMIQDYI